METEDYFSLAAVFGFVALLCVVMPPTLLSGAVNTDSFDWGYFIYASGLREIHMYFWTLKIFIFTPSVYLSIGFALGGIVKIVLSRAKIRKHRD